MMSQMVLGYVGVRRMCLENVDEGVMLVKEFVMLEAERIASKQAHATSFYSAPSCTQNSFHTPERNRL
jgi:hypothetical protein